MPYFLVLRVAGAAGRISLTDETLRVVVLSGQLERHHVATVIEPPARHAVVLRRAVAGWHDVPDLPSPSCIGELRSCGQLTVFTAFWKARLSLR